MKINLNKPNKVETHLHVFTDGPAANLKTTQMIKEGWVVIGSYPIADGSGKDEAVYLTLAKYS